MALRDVELLSLATAAHAGSYRPDASAVSPAQLAFAAQVLRLRPDSRLLILSGHTLGASKVLPPVPRQAISVSLAAPARLTATPRSSAVRASLAALPVASGAIDALAEFAPSTILALESDGAALEGLRELARVLRPSGRYLCGGAPALRPRPSQASADKRRLDDWRSEGCDVVHHTVRLVRADGSWRRLHERLRLRDLAQMTSLLNSAGFSLLNAFEAYDQQRHAIGPGGNAVLLCEKRAAGPAAGH